MHFLLGVFSVKLPSVSRLTEDDPPPGDGGPLSEVSRERVLFVEEQREELLLVSCSSVVLPLMAEGTGSLRSEWCSSLSVLLELWIEPMSGSRAPTGPAEKQRTLSVESRRRHRRVCLSNVHLGLMAQKSSSSQSSPWRKKQNPYRAGVFFYLSALFHLIPTLTTDVVIRTPMKD